jgi:nucleoid-associated protein YgaU
METAASIAQRLLKKSGSDLFREYGEIRSLLQREDYPRVRKEITVRIRPEKRLETDRVLLIGSVLKLTGAGKPSLFKFFSNHYPPSINLEQFQFIERTLFGGVSPVPSDVRFDLIEYSYFDNALVFRKAFALAGALALDLSRDILLYLFLLFARIDLSNENKMLVGLILNALAPQTMMKIVPRTLLKDYRNYVKATLASKRVKEEMRIAFRINDSDYADPERGSAASIPVSEDLPLLGERKSGPRLREVTPGGGVDKVSEGEAVDEEQALAGVNSPENSGVGEQKKGIKTTIPRTGPHRASPLRPHGRSGSKKHARSRSTLPLRERTRTTRKSILHPAPAGDSVNIGRSAALPAGPSECVRSAGWVRIRNVFETLDKKKQILIAAAFILAVCGAVILFLSSTGGSKRENATPRITLAEKQFTDSVESRYTIRKGDTLAQISERYLHDAGAYPIIAEINGIKNPHLIYPDRILVIPSTVY